MRCVMRKKCHLYLVLILSLFLSSNFSFAQDNARIIGQILDGVTRAPIQNVNLYFEKSNLGSITNEKGNFVLENLKPGNQVLIVQHIAYAQKKINITLTTGQTKQLDILLTPKVLSFDGVVFTASRHAETIFQSQKNIEMASEEDISVRTSPNTSDAIREIPGVLVQKTTAGHGAPILRGMIGKDVLLLYNGIRLNKPTFRFGANQYMNTIDAESLDRIEVIKGPGSVMYGSDAIGGIVNMISEPPLSFEQEKGLQTTFSTRYGSADQSRIIHSGIMTNLGNLVFSSGLTWKKIGDLQAGGGIGSQTPTGYDEWNGNLKLGWKLNHQTSLDFDVLAVRQSDVPRYDKYVTGKYETYLFEPQNRYLSSLALHSRPEKIGWINSLQWNVSYQFEEEGTIQRKTGKDYITKNRNDLKTFGSFLQVNSTWLSKHVITYGYEIYWDNVARTSVREQNNSVQSQRGNFPDGSKYRSFGVFLKDNIIFRPNFDLNLGLRWSQMKISSFLDEKFGDFEDTYSDFTGTVGMSYKPETWLNIIVSYAKGFRAPNFNDAVVLKVSNAGVDAPSSGLSPEKSHNFECGFKVERSPANGSFFVFYNRIVDLIDRYLGRYQGLTFFDENGNAIQDADEFDIYQKRNVAEAYIAGFELAGEYRINSKWRLRGNTFWTYGRNVTVNEPMSRIPPFMGLFSVRREFSQKMALETFIRAAKKQDRLSARDIDDSRIDPNGTPGWWTFNLRGEYEIVHNLKLNVMVENIFDETYKEHGSGVYSPGMNVVVGLRYVGD